MGMWIDADGTIHRSQVDRPTNRQTMYIGDRQTNVSRPQAFQFTNRDKKSLTEIMIGENTLIAPTKST